MALILCPKCGKQYSEHADACPQCGLRRASIPIYLQKEQEKKRQEEEIRAKAEEERIRLRKEAEEKAAEIARIRKEHREEWLSKHKKKVGIAILIIIGIIVGVCCIKLLMTKHNIRMAMLLVEQGDSLANNYQIDQAYVCYSDALKIESDDDTYRIIKSRQQWLSKKIQEAESEYENNLRRLKILLDADDNVFNEYSNECLDNMIKIYPNRQETIYFRELKNKQTSQNSLQDKYSESILEAVDLGLSVMWGSCNLGAPFPDEFGEHYAWGETSSKSNFTWKTYSLCKGNSKTMIKYCLDRSSGKVDSRYTLLPCDDVATTTLGANWRIPTYSDFNELINNCTWTYTTFNDVPGYIVTGKNGNSIFLPFAGYYQNSEHKEINYQGAYWCSTLDEKHQFGAHYVELTSNRIRWDYCNRCCGLSIRPIRLI